MTEVYNKAAVMYTQQEEIWRLGDYLDWPMKLKHFYLRMCDEYNDLENEYDIKFFENWGAASKYAQKNNLKFESKLPEEFWKEVKRYDYEIDQMERKVSALKSNQLNFIKNSIKLNKYWLNPTGANKPEFYEQGIDKTIYLEKLIVDHVNLIDVDRILELGCNVGRNLAFLKDRLGFFTWGIEINREAAIRARIKGLLVQIEDIAKADYRNPDLIFTMAVLQHIPDEDFPEVVERIDNSTAKWLITIEDERESSPRHYPRNYKREFKCEWDQVYRNRPTIKERRIIHKIFKRRFTPGFNHRFVARVFKRK